MRAHKLRGFTLVELIIVIILLAILSVYAASRYTGLGSFSALAIQDSVISIVRQVQLDGMHSSVTTGNDSFTLQISPQCFGSKSACTDREGRSDWVAHDDVTFSASPKVSEIQFDLLGSPEGDASGGVTITIHGSNSNAMVSICPNGLISKTGCY